MFLNGSGSLSLLSSGWCPPSRPSRHERWTNSRAACTCGGFRSVFRESCGARPDSCVTAHSCSSLWLLGRQSCRVFPPFPGPFSSTRPPKAPLATANTAAKRFPIAGRDETCRSSADLESSAPRDVPFRNRISGLRCCVWLQSGPGYGHLATFARSLRSQCSVVRSRLRKATS
jgi:hypothetical protein